MATGVDQLSALAADYGTRLEEQGVLAPGTVDELLASVDRITTGVTESLVERGIDPIVIERTEDDLDFGGIVDSVRFWSTVGLGVAVVAAITILVVSPVALLRRFVPIGIAIAVAGLLLVLVSRGTVLLSLENASLRFAPEDDGRGERLSGIDVRCSNRTEVFAAADRLGCRSGEHTIRAAGLDITCVD